MFPTDASLEGHRIDALFWLATALTAPAFAAVLAILITSVVRFREREGHEAVYTHGSSKQALALTLGLTAIVFLVIDVNLAVNDDAAFEALYAKAPDESKALRVRVTAEQFLWTFRYAGADGKLDTPDDPVVTGELHVPAGRPVIFELGSRDVIHSFCVPNLRLKQDAVPGMTTYAWSTPTVPGTYEVMCAQLCGFGHYAMRGRLVVDEPAAFERWLAERTSEFGFAAR